MMVVLFYLRLLPQKHPRSQESQLELSRMFQAPLKSTPTWLNMPVITVGSKQIIPRFLGIYSFDAANGDDVNLANLFWHNNDNLNSSFLVNWKVDLKFSEPSGNYSIPSINLRLHLIQPGFGQINPYPYKPVGPQLHAWKLVHIEFPLYIEYGIFWSFIQ